MESSIWKIRSWIYIIGICSVGCISVSKCTSLHAVEYVCDTGESSDDSSGSNDFWPPDMIPHPSCPGDGPGEKQEPVMS